MTGKNTDKGEGSREGSCRRLSGDRRMKNEGRVDQAKSSVENAVDTVVGTLTARKRNKR